jgi:endonuclease/exonuclease/phosphatase family metal-dependent hydrolase
MDFIFVPSTWTVDSVEVGSFHDYVGKRLSDHVPVVATIRDGADPIFHTR